MTAPADVCRHAAERVRRAGFGVEFVPGWQTRGRPYRFTPIVQYRHGTASPATSSNTAAKNICIHGRSGLPGPLCHFYVSGARRGATPRLYVVSAGYANHAGRGVWSVIQNASKGVPPRPGRAPGSGDATINRYAWGTEYEHSNSTGEPIPPSMLRLMAELEAGVAEAEGWVRQGGPRFAANHGIDHREATSRKIDLPSHAGDVRGRVATLLAGGTVDGGGGGTEMEVDDMGPGDSGKDVAWWQRRLKNWNADALPKYGVDGDEPGGGFGDETTVWTRKFQEEQGLEPTGRVNVATVGQMINLIRARALSHRIGTHGHDGAGAGAATVDGLSDEDVEFLAALVAELRATDGTPSSVRHVLRYYRHVRDHFTS